MKKYLVTIETKNYPVNLYPIIQRYSTVKKYLTKEEIATCIMSHAYVKLYKQDGITVQLTRENFRKVISDFDSAVLAQMVSVSASKAEEKNREELDKLIESENTVEPDPQVTTLSTPQATEPESTDDDMDEATRDNEEVEVAQADPEDPDTYDYSHFSDSDDD
jgi:hypothetical protein